MYRSQWHWMGQKLTKSHHLQVNVQIQIKNCSSPTMWVTNGPVPPNLAAVTFSVLFGHGWKNSCRWHCLFFIFKDTAYSVWASCLRVTGWVASELMLRSGVKVAKGKTLIVVQFPAHFSWTCQLRRVQPTSRWVAAWVFSSVSVNIFAGCEICGHHWDIYQRTSIVIQTMSWNISPSLLSSLALHVNRSLSWPSW